MRTLETRRVCFSMSLIRDGTVSLFLLMRLARLREELPQLLALIGQPCIKGPKWW